MKKFMIALCMSLMVVGSAWCMEEQEGEIQEHVQDQAQRQQEMIKIKTSDDVEIEVPKPFAKVFVTLKNLMVDIPEEVIPLPLVNKEQWDIVSGLFGGLADYAESQRKTELDKRIGGLELLKLLLIATPLEYLDPVMSGLQSSQQLAELVVQIVVERIKANPDQMIALLQQGKFTIPVRIESQVAQALLIAKKIIREPYERIDTQDFREPKQVAWSSDGRLAVGCVHGVIIVEPNGAITRINTIEFQWIKSVAWSSGGRLVIIGTIYQILEGSAIIVEPDGTQIPINTQGLGFILSAAWSSGGRLAVRGSSGVIIVEPDGARNRINFPYMGWIKSIAWSSGGRLAVGGEDGAIIVEPNGIQIPINTEGLGQTKSVAWSSDGRLAVACVHRVIVVEPNGAINRINFPYRGPIKSVAWSSDGRLAVGRRKGAIIVEPNGIQIPINTEGLGRIKSVAWSSDGRLAVGCKNGAIIVERDGAITPINTQGLGRTKSVAWSSDGRLAVMGSRFGVSIYNGEIPQEYKNLSIAQAFLIIKLAEQAEPRYLNDEEYKMYTSLPEEIQGRYTAEPPMLD